MEEEKKSVNNTNLSAVKMVIFVDFSVGWMVGIGYVCLVSTLWLLFYIFACCDWQLSGRTLWSVGERQRVAASR